tara:strand:- start:125 stop:295 length:171 start_codon:yes stop_codon:yes gene_type:complete
VFRISLFEALNRSFEVCAVNGAVFSSMKSFANALNALAKDNHVSYSYLQEKNEKIF